MPFASEFLPDKKTVSVIVHHNMTNVFKNLQTETSTIKITEAHKHFWPVAVNAAVLYFLVDKLNKINPVN